MAPEETSVIGNHECNEFELERNKDVCELKPTLMRRNGRSGLRIGHMHFNDPCIEEKVTKLISGVPRISTLWHAHERTPKMVENVKARVGLKA